jgi:hypothetical protein
MALITGLGLFVVSIFVAVLSKIAAEEFAAWSPSVIRSLIKFAVLRLPENKRERFEEEWQAHVNDVPGHIGKLLVAVGFFFAACDIALNDRRNEVLEGWRQLLARIDDVHSASTTILNLSQNTLEHKSLCDDALPGLVGRIHEEVLNCGATPPEVRTKLSYLLNELDNSEQSLRATKVLAEERNNRLKSNLNKSQKRRNRLANRIAKASANQHSLVRSLGYTLVNTVKLRKDCVGASQMAQEAREQTAEFVGVFEERKKLAGERAILTTKIVKLLDERKKR